MSKDWTQFFKEAGLPLSIAKRYSVTFDDNRISSDMLMDLNKEILTSMGITAMGDVINILKHAKKTHSQDMRKKDSVTSKSVVVSKRPPPPTAHSTTPGHSSAVSTTKATQGHAVSAVSTTSTSTKKKIVAKYPKAELPDTLSPELPGASSQEQEVAFLGYILDPKKDLVLEQPLTSARVERFPASVVHPEIPVEELSDLVEGGQYQELETFKGAQYEAIKPKPPMTLYSDELAEQPQSQSQGPRVIILPGEGQDIFTTSGLQKAAKVYETGQEQEGKLTTDRSRRLLESAGLIPVAKDRSSIFSRLDYKPSVVAPPSSAAPTSVTKPVLAPPTTSTATAISKRIIKLSKAHPAAGATSHSVSSSSSPGQLSRTVVKVGASSQRKVATRSPTVRVRASTTSSSSPSSQVLDKRLVSSRTEPRPLGARRLREEAKPVAERLGVKRSSVSGSSSGARAINDSSPVITSTVRLGGRLAPKRSGVSAHEEAAVAAKRPRMTSRSSEVKIRGSEVKVRGSGVRVRSTMVADEYEYQSQRQRDIRSRLEMRELEKRARRGGPLMGRLALHQVFGRLE